MAKSEITKYRLAESIKQCMKTTSVDDITIRQIVENCGLTRQTFYRNFLDKYDLINWYFDKLLHKSFEHMGSGETIYKGLKRKFDYIQEERVFFSAAFRSDAQNSLKDHDFELILQFYTNLIREKTGHVPDSETSFLLEMYCQSSIYMTAKWVLGGMKMSSDELAHMLVKAMPLKLEELFTMLGVLA
ncbi:MAG: TetR/AcrR family transcriptional regulator C-terminal domain-containing protein [Bariatricus sp.]|nr:TetR/AcrR family transcriptional regulator C-terminal domain-containing protein [Bariatricus sp.]